MALESALDALSATLGRLRAVLIHDAQPIVIEDCPRGKLKPIEQLREAFGDVTTALEGIERSTGAAVKGAAHPGDMYRVRRALGECHDRFSELSNTYASELTSWERVSLVRRCCAEHGVEWRSWWKEAAQSIEACREPIEEVERALLTCWRELTDHLGAGGLSVHAQVGHTLTVHEALQENER